MKSTSVRRRLAGSVVTALVVGAGVLVTAHSAAAKANEVAVGTVSFHKPDVQVQVIYSCDPGLGQELVANATAIDSMSPDAGSAAGVIKKDRLVCDYGNHTATVTLHTASGTHFAKGDKVKVAVFYFGKDGSVLADQTAAAVL
ncbi:hypothetical protein AAW14_00360 [Streptomyces hygroscopicus]|uniref:hypothetical protein n=1 Tax=Streptomyces hygroscopicus TaxID=1912 RepID=UPI002240DA4B|nr:hypothetical protein [Streptomyces hygroscopicus]MCW7940559.1 hypothetical protein [Streptomyces hygroscopicus]